MVSVTSSYEEKYEVNVRNWNNFPALGEVGQTLSVTWALLWSMETGEDPSLLFLSDALLSELTYQVLYLMDG